MRVLKNIQPTAEQLKLVSRYDPGAIVIRGAAGSGKTTTALLRLNALTAAFRSRHQRLGLPGKVRILVLTFNRTLKGYIEELAQQQIAHSSDFSLEVETFAHWARQVMPMPGEQVSDADQKQFLEARCRQAQVPLPLDYAIKETEYAQGRFLPPEQTEYLTARRHGRGALPRVERPVRERILADVLAPYESWKRQLSLWDYNDHAVQLATTKIAHPYDVVVVDECQDFSANQIRGIVNQLKSNHSITFIVDTAQRIYSRGFSWAEVGVQVRPENSVRLQRNYRNTLQVAAFAAPLLSGLAADDDATMPDLSSCSLNGAKPVVLIGKYSQQLSYAIQRVLPHIDLTNESVAFLHAKGGNWFSETRRMLGQAGFPFVEISRRPDWPKGNENIALSTIHSAKGLEFDHVFMIGLNGEVLPEHDNDNDDDRQISVRRLIAMGIARARKGVLLGYKEDQAPSIIAHLDPATFALVKL